MGKVNLEDWQSVYEGIWDARNHFSTKAARFADLVDRLCTRAKSETFDPSIGIAIERGEDPSQFLIKANDRTLQFSFKATLNSHDDSVASEIQVHLVPRFPEIEGWLKLGSINMNRSQILVVSTRDDTITQIPNANFTSAACFFVIEALKVGFVPKANPPHP